MGAVGAAARQGKVGRFQLKSTQKTKLPAMADDAKLQEIQKLGGTAIKPVGWDRTGWEAFQYMLWNPDTGEILTRTPLSWLKITVFYCIYYSCLAGFWIACLNVFFATLPAEQDGTRWLQEDTIIHPSENEGECDLNADYVARTKKFLKNYDNTNMGSREKKLRDPTATEGEMENYPVFSLATLGECGEGQYGYVVNPPQKGKPAELVKPCIFIKLNTIWGWVPKPYDCAKEKNKGDESEGPCLPDIEKHLASQGADVKNNVYINCRGRYAADQEALAGGLEYFPRNQGIPISYFPYVGKTKEATYHAPLVAVKITPGAGREGQLIHIECRAYYDGVKHITKTKEGMVMFELQNKDE